MKNFLHTITPKCHRYFINGRRVAREFYYSAMHQVSRLECLQTVRKGETFRHYSVGC